MGFKKFLQGEDDCGVRRADKPKKINNYDAFIAKKHLRLQVGDKTKNVEITRPADFKDIERLIDKMRASDGVIADLSCQPPETAQRMLDFLCGAVYAFSGDVSRLDDAKYLLTPKNVRIIVNLKDV